MDIFPAQYSTLSSVALGRYIEEKYGFAGITCKLLLHGVSDTYRIEGENVKYILKVYRSSHRTLEEIRGEIELLNTLHERGAKVAYPLRDLHGEQIQPFNAIEGMRYGVVFMFAPGNNVYDFSDEQLMIIGREMAFNHTITSQIELGYERKPYTAETTLWRPLEVVKPWFAEESADYAYLVELANEVDQKMATFDNASLSSGYCHYDYLPKNFHFDGNLFTLFDFDFAGKGYLANDLASFLVHFFFHTITGKITKEEADRQFSVFIKGYRDVRTLSDEEIEAVPFLGIMFWLFYLGFQVENFDDWSNSFVGPRYLKERVAIIKRFSEMYCRF